MRLDVGVGGAEHVPGELGGLGEPEEQAGGLLALLRATPGLTLGEIGERLELARRQVEEQGEFDHVVVNDDVAEAADAVLRILETPDP